MIWFRFLSLAKLRLKPSSDRVLGDLPVALDGHDVPHPIWREAKLNPCEKSFDRQPKANLGARRRWARARAGQTSLPIPTRWATRAYNGCW
jgi:hypothetical protein